jgi:Tfp pilus assembly protein PilX
MIIKPQKISLLYVKQQGLVLFIALIALVAMSLAAAALIRSVDTGVLVAGNLAFKQAALMSGDASLAQASNYITTNALTLTTDNETSGYHATTTNVITDPDYLDLRSAATWDDLRSELAAGTGFTAGRDTSGNTVRYIIQRMCRNEGAPNVPGTDCLFGTAVTGGGSSKPCTSGGCPPPNTAPSPAYRVTSRITGPKNTVSYIQAYIY